MMPKSMTVRAAQEALDKLLAQMSPGEMVTLSDDDGVSQAVLFKVRPNAAPGDSQKQRSGKLGGQPRRLAELRASLKEAISAKRWTEAEGLAQEWLELEPGSPQAAQTLSWIETMSPRLELRRTPGGLVIATPENLKDLLSMPDPPERVWWEKAKMEFCLVPAGELVMGISEEEARRWDEEAKDSLDWHHQFSAQASAPAHQVYLDAYYIGRYPVTNRQYDPFVQLTGYPAPSGWQRNGPPPDKLDHPVEYVTWENARAYCEWAGLRLPTEAEWEKAASWDWQIGRKRIYPWGDEWDIGRCNTRESEKNGATPVGTYSPAGDSPYGCADMAGNVLEWVADWYGENYYRVSPARNPKGPDSGQEKVLRGGSWLNTSDGARGAFRLRGTVDYRYFGIGFRCARN